MLHMVRARPPYKMQIFTIKTPEFIHLEESFGEWLRLLNFEQSTVKYAPRKAREFLCWMEQQQIIELSAITKQVIENYFEYLKTRRNNRRKGKLSRNYLRTHITALRKLARYLRETGRESFEVDVQLPGKIRNIKTIFSRSEIKALYNACEGDALGIRDRAMLSVYYGCGLRRNEGINLDVSDVLLNKNLLYVSKGKNYKERYVPMTEAVKEDIQNYLDFVRPMFLNRPTNALFLSYAGNRLITQSIATRLQKLKEKAGIDKEAGLHTLRHSIATHLLQSGMKLSQIKRFLGHSSMESTQIYTHLAHELS
jgi:integrase/recombinase XerD